jgi:acyl-CoA synthetase (AMP-forming)/AMP-acid ligase II
MTLRSVSIADIIRRNAQLFPERTALIFGDQRISHRDYLVRVKQLAAGLAACGVVAGDRVAVVARNKPEYADLCGAAAWLGAILVPVNWRLSAQEITYVLADGDPKVVIADIEDQPAIASMSGSLPSTTGFYGLGGHQHPFRSFSELTALTGPAPHSHAAVEHGYVMIHTAAVDGRPRGALLSQFGLIAAGTQQLHCWQLDERDVGVVAVPLFHVAGLGLFVALLLAGATALILPKFDPDLAARQIEAEKATVFTEFAPMLKNLLDKSAESGSDLSSLRMVTGLDTPETIGRFEAAYPKGRFWAAYGQSEVSGIITMAPWRERPGSAGRPTFLNIVAVVDERDEMLPPNQVGEIVVRGPTVFHGYWRRDDDNASTFRNGWHHTGDMGRLDDDGYLWYAGRSSTKELIKTGGENVYPADVEKVISAHSAIAEVVVIGVPDPQWGEAIKAVCVSRPGCAVAARELMDFVASKVARYKKPKYVVFVDALPKTATGGLDRAKVKQAHGGV